MAFMKRRALIVFFLSLCLTGVVSGQEEELPPTLTPNPTETATPAPETPLPQTLPEEGSPTPQRGEFFLSTRADILLPVEIRFVAQVAGNANLLESAEITLFQASGFERVIPLDFADESAIPNRETDTTILQAILPLGGDDLPRLFEPMSYRWRITTTEGDTFTEAAEFLFVPPAPSEWQEAGEPPLILHWYEGGMGGSALLGNLQLVYQRLQTDTQVPMFLRFAIFEQEAAFCQDITNEAGETRRVFIGTDNSCNLRRLERFLRRSSDLTFIQREEGGFEATEAQLIGEMVRQFYGAYWPEDAAVPEWFIEGLIAYYRPYGGLFELVQARSANQSGLLLPLEALNAPRTSDNGLWEAQSYLFLLYLADAYGADVPVRIAQAVASAPSFEEAFMQATGTSVNAAYRLWLSWLDTETAEIAAAWNPYLATTPTLTPTRTLTPIPPTATPTLTLTPSPTLTATPPFFQPSATFTRAAPVTLTPIPTETNTPLPPGSLPPVPTSTPTPEESGSSGLPCGATALILPALVIALRGRASRKGKQPHAA